MYQKKQAAALKRIPVLYPIYELQAVCPPRIYLRLVEDLVRAHMDQHGHIGQLQVVVNLPGPGTPRRSSSAGLTRRRLLTLNIYECLPVPLPPLFAYLSDIGCQGRCLCFLNDSTRPHRRYEECVPGLVTI